MSEADFRAHPHRDRAPSPNAESSGMRSVGPGTEGRLSGAVLALCLLLFLLGSRSSPGPLLSAAPSLTLLLGLAAAVALWRSPWVLSKLPVPLHFAVVGFLAIAVRSPAPPGSTWPYECLLIYLLSAGLLAGLGAVEVGLLSLCGGAAYLLAGATLAGVAPAELSALMLVGLVCTLARMRQGRIERSYHRQLDLLLELNRRDPLTGLYHHRHFFEVGDQVLLQARRQQAPAALLLLDVDHFKRYNDRHGHLQGDHALRGLARLLQDQTRRPFDLAGRLGGEEFGLLFYDTPRYSAHQLAQRLCRRIAAAGSPEASPTTGITVSIGLACTAAVGSETLEQLFLRADRALYQAKHAGRNAVVVAEDPV
ncbi:MAG: GGDEF domain-containing protein [Stagnimonas sp.]|nr:GGDEF domain-containing protein [Stagnimonas sp.]